MAGAHRPFHARDKILAPQRRKTKLLRAIAQEWNFAVAYSIRELEYDAPLVFGDLLEVRLIVRDHADAQVRFRREHPAELPTAPAAGGPPCCLSRQRKRRFPAEDSQNVAEGSQLKVSTYQIIPRQVL